MTNWRLLLTLPFAAALVAASATDTLADTKLATDDIDHAALTRAIAAAAKMPRLRSLVVAHRGTVVFEKVYRGPSLSTPVNIKSVSKTIISALVGVAIERGQITGTDQPIIKLLGNNLPTGSDPKIREITVGNLLSMQAGLERTSGRNYGRWVASRDWIKFALSRPFIEPPGGRMLYSTGNTHLLSAILTRATGRDTLALARDWLGKPLGIRIPAWQKDPQGIYLGGNNMLLSPRALLRIGEMYRNGGLHEGNRVLPENWVRASWRPQTRSRFSGDLYGYGWFIDRVCGEPAPYARGFGGQFVYVVPNRALTIVITSDPTVVSWRDGYRNDLRAMLADIIQTAPHQNPALDLLGDLDDSHIPPSDSLGRRASYREACPA